jgi:non-homologous end joining protein Ku
VATRSKRKKKTKPRSKFRASWRGRLRFGLVSFDVQAVNAENKQQSEVHFHLLHEADNERIRYEKVCPKHGEVPSDEIVQGYEVAKGKYVSLKRRSSMSCGLRRTRHSPSTRL